MRDVLGYQESKLKPSKCIYTRRGGPNYQKGLAKMRTRGEEIGILLEVRKYLRSQSTLFFVLLYVHWWWATILKAIPLYRFMGLMQLWLAKRQSSASQLLHKTIENQITLLYWWWMDLGRWQRMDTASSVWKSWNWRSEGGLLLNGAYFTPFGADDREGTC